MGQDVWQTPSELAGTKQGDCEDYAVLAASIATNKNISANQLRVVNGLIGYGGNAPRSHTVLLYDPDGSNFALGSTPEPYEDKKFFTNSQLLVN